jgi:hypothetical protein
VNRQKDQNSTDTPAPIIEKAGIKGLPSKR